LRISERANAAWNVFITRVFRTSMDFNFGACSQQFQLTAVRFVFESEIILLLKLICDFLEMINF